MLKRILVSLADLRRSLRADESGGAVVMVALSVPVAVAALSAGVDTGAWYMEKRRVQQIADAAALGGARALSTGQTVSTAKAVAQRDAARNGYAVAAGSGIVVHSPPVAGPYAGKAGAVEVVVTRPLPSLFSAYVLGASSRSVSGRAVAFAPPVQKRNLEVAMVLDVSSSMASSTETRGVSKMRAQQNAATQLIEVVIQGSQSPYTSRVALAPFSSSVNVGSAYFRTVTNKSLSGSWSGVVERTGSYRFTDDPPNATYRYFGDFRTKRTGAMGANSAFVQAMSSQTPSSANTIEPLSSDKEALQSAVNGLTPNGTTAAHLGLAWAWYMLSPKWNSIFTGPAQASASDAAKTYKAIVVLSDFDFNSYYESGNGTANAQFEQLCVQAKAAGIKVFTVGYNVPNSSANARRINCASPTADGVTYTYTTSTVDDLVTAFQAIASQTVSGASEAALRIVE